ncbi:MAG: FtsX-like permease family protein, partial [Microbacteriaceae bacterium]
ELSRIQSRSAQDLDFNLAKPDAAVPEIYLDSRANRGENTLLVNGTEVRVVQETALLPGYPLLSPWLLIDEQDAKELSVTPVYDQALATLNENFDYDTALTQIRDILGPSALVDTPERFIELQDAQPTVIGLKIALFAAAILGLLLAVGSLLLYSFTIGPSRNKLFPLLTSLGVQSGTRRKLLSWEIIPLALTALLSSVAAGIALGLLMTFVLDLSGFTGGESHPALSFDWVTLGALLGLFVVGIVVTILLNLAMMKRLDLSKVLRT